MKDKLDQLIDSLLVDLADLSEKSSRKSEFRISSFPYCPIRALLFNDNGQDSFSMDFYVSIGTAVHTVLQKWLTKGNFRDKIFARWKLKSGEIVGPCLFRDIPEKYHNQLGEVEYEEVVIEYNGLSGHVDLIFEILPGKFVIIDFKTTNLTGNKRKYPIDWKSKYPASRNSIIQISSYSTLLRTIYKLNVIGWCLVYIDRGDVIKTKANYYKVLRPWNKTKHKYFLEFIDKACDNNKRLVKLNKILNSGRETYSEKANKLLTNIVKNRPCKCEHSYDSFMAYKFNHYKKSKEEELRTGTKNGACVLKKQCLTSSKSTLKAIYSKLDK